MRSFLDRFRRPRLPADEQLTLLLSILDRAVAAAPATEEAVRACGAPGEVPGQVGHTCGELTSVYHRLREELASIPADDCANLAAQAERLLQYHQWLLHNAAQLAFSRTPDPRTEAMRRRLDGVGPPAARLMALRDRVAQLRSSR
ncbi:hypothetical protein DMP23_19755 [Amycolatopsis sp. A1MSW2902]|uniref:hypothetical protein n=1 Tax=Amycolatopsis sp. A1MSW2902 TaxID=687413 RepID=UPI00307EB335